MNPCLNRIEKIVLWTLSIGFALLGLVYCSLGFWLPGAIDLVVAVLAFPRNNIPSGVRLLAAFIGILTTL